jgi:ribose-phosphate pyrophosphokinase
MTGFACRSNSRILEKPVDHLLLQLSFTLCKKFRLNNLNCFSRYGRFKRAYAYSKFLESDVVICYKQRKEALSAPWN